MLESIMKAMSEVGNEVGKKVSSDLPDFAKNMKPNEVRSFEDADKSLSKVKKEKEEISEASPFGDSINENIRTPEELEVYQDANLKEVTINDKPSLIKNDIDLEATDDFGRTNLQRMENGLAPLDESGNPTELHHIGQKSDSSLAELSREEHRGSENFSKLHEIKESEIDRTAFDTERANHWKERAKQMEG